MEYLRRTAGNKQESKPSGEKWDIDGHGKAYQGQIKFWVAAGKLHIARASSQQRDNSGIIVHPNSGNPSVANIFEQDFPTTPGSVSIVAPAGTNHVFGSSTPQFTASIGYQQPGTGVMTMETCSWDFTFGPVILHKVPEKPQPNVGP